MKFKDIEFKKMEGFYGDGVKAEVSFPNGWGASIVRHNHTYGGDRGLFELAVIDAEGEINYSTSVTNDVLGWLNPGDVEATLSKISALPPALEVKNA